MYLSVPCDSGTATFPSNTISKFRVKLPQEIHLSKDNWRVGLASVQYSHTFEVVAKFTAAMQIGTLDPDVEGHTATIDGFYCRDTEDLLTRLTRAINDAFRPIHETDDDLLAFRIPLSLKRVFLKKAHFSDEHVIYVRLPCGMLNALGFDTEQHVDHDPLGSCWIKTGTQARHLHNANIPFSINVHCDLAQPTRATGDKFSAVLRSAPIRGEYGQVVYYEPKIIQFFPLRYNTFSEIGIELTDDRDKPMSFMAGKTVVHLYLKKTF